MKLIERKFMLALLAGAALSLGIFAGCSDGSSSGGSGNEDDDLSTVTADNLSVLPGTYDITITAKSEETYETVKGTGIYREKGTITFGSSPKTSSVEYKYQEESDSFTFSSKEDYDTLYAQKSEVEKAIKDNMLENDYTDIKISWDEKNLTITSTGKNSYMKDRVRWSYDDSDDGKKPWTYEEFIKELDPVPDEDDIEDGITYTDKKIQQNSDGTVIVVSFTEKSDDGDSYYTLRMEKQ